jgi:purine-nucleoside phosphorylase
MGTPHNSAETEDVAKKVIMPGDPLRARFIAENFLENARCINEVRNMLAYTGTYKGTDVTVMGSGMGMPSMGIYSYELFKIYDVDEIIRVGTAGGIRDDVHVRDVVIALGTSTNSNYGMQYKLPGTFAPLSDFELAVRAVQAAKQENIPVKTGNILSSDTFYTEHASDNDLWKQMGVLAVEMETAALYMNAARLGKKALGIFTISDHLYTGEALTAQERQTTFTDMIKIALESL